MHSMLVAPGDKRGAGATDNLEKKKNVFRHRTEDELVFSAGGRLPQDWGCILK